MKKVTVPGFVKPLGTLCICVALIVGAFYFLFPLFLHWKVSDIAHREWGISLHYDRIGFKKWGLLFEKVGLKGKTDEANYTVVADEILISPKIDWDQAKLLFSINTIQPVIELQPTSPLPKEQFFNSSETSSSWWSTSWNVSEGILILHDPKEAHTLQTTFSLQSNASNLSVKIFQGKESLLLENHSSSLTSLQLTANNLQLAEWTPLFHWLFPESEEWEITSGILNGQFSQLSNATTLTGEWEIDALEGHSKTMLMQFPKVQGTMEPSTKTAFKGTLFTASVVQPGLLSHTTGPAPYWSLRNIAGKCTLNDLLSYEFQGQFLSDDQPDALLTLHGTTPLTLQEGEMASFELLLAHSPTPLSIEAELHRTSPDKTTLDLHVKNLSSKEYQLLAHAFPEGHSLWNEVLLRHGELSCDLLAHFNQDWQLQDLLSIRSFSGRELSVQIPKLHIEGNLDQVSGQMTLKAAQDTLLPQEGSLHVDSGELFWLHSTGPFTDQLEHLEGVSLDVAFASSRLQQGHFEGTLSGLSTAIDFYGFDHPTVAELQIKGKTNPIIDFLPPFLQQILGEETVDWKAKMEVQEEEVFLTSNLALQKETSLSMALDLHLERLRDYGANTLQWQLWGISLLENQESYVLSIDWLKDPLGPFVVQLKEGTLQSEHLPLEPFSEIFFAKEEGKIDGECRFKGDFNNQSMLVHFEVEDFLLKTADFTITAEKLGLFPSQKARLNAPASFFFYSFKEKIPRSFIPLTAGTYENHATHVKFEDASALVYIGRNSLRLSHIRTQSEGLQFVGAIDVNFDSKEGAPIEIHTQQVSGSVANLFQFCRHFDGLQALTALPLEGKVFSGANGVELKTIYFYDPARKSQFEWSVEGDLEEGSWKNFLGESQLQELACHFTYHSTEGLLEISDLKGTLQTIDHSFALQESSLLCDYSENEKLRCHLQLTLFDKLTPWTEIKADLTPDLHQKHLWNLFVEQSSHIGPLYPRLTQLLFSFDEGIESLYAAPTVDLQALKTNLSDFFATHALEKWEPQGSLSGIFKKEEGIYSWDLHAPQFALQGHGKGDNWTVASLRLDGIELTNGSLHFQEDALAINPFTLILDSKEWQGTLQGAFSFAYKDKTFQCDFNTPQLSFNHHPLALPPLFSLSGKMLEGLQEVTLESHNRWILYAPKFSLEKLQPESIRFSVEPSSVSPLWQIASTLFEWPAHPELNRLFASLKENEPLKGVWSGSNNQWTLNLQAGTYHLFGYDLAIQSLNCLFHTPIAEMTIQTQIQKAPVSLLIRYDSAHEHDNLLQAKGEGQTTPPLQMLWGFSHQNGLSIKSIQGTLPGLSCQFNGSGPQALYGSCTLLDRSALSPFLPQGLQEWMESWQVDKGYTWTGSIDWSDRLQLSGQLRGRNFSLLGASWKSLQAQCDYTARGLEIRHLLVRDAPMELSIGSIRLFHPPTAPTLWQLEMPSFVLKNLTPAAFYSMPQRLRPFTIPEARLDNLLGILSNSNSWRGSGMVQFEKRTSKQGFIGSLFMIPADILGKIGLNPNALSPAMGRLYFTLQDGKALLTRLDGAYSEGKLSRFYLAKSPPQSYIDFDGRLNIYLRMKQYNLLLKFVESLGIRISGTWDAPKISTGRF